MIDLLLYNAKIFQCHQFDQINQFNILGISDGKITLLEHSDLLNKTNQNNLLDLINNSKKAIDLENKWITPGLIDCHTHLIFAGSRVNEFSARLEGKSYEEITLQGGGIHSTVQSTRQASYNELQKIAVQRIKRVIKQGITTIEIKSGYGLDGESEKKILQVADYLSKNYPIDIQKTFLGAHVLPKDYQYSNDYITYITENVLPDLYQAGLVDALDSFCEKIAFSADELQPLYQKARELGLPVKGHTEQLSNIGGAGLICRYQGLSCDHLEFADEKVVKQLSDSGATAVLLPGAYYYLRESQLPPVNLLRQYNIPIAVATDFNPGTSPILSLSTIMNMACVLYRLTPHEVWQAVTINAAKALGMADRLGSIDLNKQADLVIWDFEHPYELCYFMGYDWNKQILKRGKFINEQYTV